MKASKGTGLSFGLTLIVCRALNCSFESVIVARDVCVKINYSDRGIRCKILFKFCINFKTKTVKLKSLLRYIYSNKVYIFSSFENCQIYYDSYKLE